MSETSEEIKKLAEKITAMREKQSSQQQKKKTDSLSAQMFQVMIELVSGIIVGSSIGYILDEIFDFRFVCLLIFTIFGGVAGFINMTRYMKKTKEYKEEN